MTDADRTDRNRERLTECHPAFRHRLAMVLAQLQSQGFRPRIQDAWRSPEDQLLAFQTGHSKLRWGFQTAPDGLPDALAADVLDDDAPLNPRLDFVFALAKEALLNGLTTGITWGLPPTIRKSLNYAILNEATWTGKIGWDACHVEVVGVSVQQAMAGVRPVSTETLA